MDKALTIVIPAYNMQDYLERCLDSMITEKAKELLDITKLNITDISYQLGFENVSQFSTFFRRKTGVPPLQYRKEGQHFKKPL